MCEEAEKAMRAMAASMPPLPLLKKLKAYVHHANLRVRAKAAVAISHCAARMVRHAPTPRQQLIIARDAPQFLTHSFLCLAHRASRR